MYNWQKAIIGILIACLALASVPAHAESGAHARFDRAGWRRPVHGRRLQPRRQGAGARRDRGARPGRDQRQRHPCRHRQPGGAQVGRTWTWMLRSIPPCSRPSTTLAIRRPTGISCSPAGGARRRRSTPNVSPTKPLARLPSRPSLTTSRTPSAARLRARSSHSLPLPPRSHCSVSRSTWASSILTSSLAPSNAASRPTRSTSISPPTPR